MTLSTFALVIATLCYLVGLPLVFTSHTFMKWKDGVLKHEGSVRGLGMLLTIVAATILARQYHITMTKAGLLVFVAWMTLIKGIVMTWWPMTCINVHKKIEACIHRSARNEIIAGCILVFIGAVFAYMYFAR